MAWKPELTAKLLDDKASEIMRAYLREQIPPFVAPTDAVAWPGEARRIRERALRDVFLKGYPEKVVKAKPRVVWGEVLQPAKEYVIRKLRYECYPGYWVPGLLYEPTGGEGPRPVMLNPEGHYRGGMFAGYKQIRCANLARRGVLALSMEFLGMGELEADCYHGTGQALLNVTGLAGVGLFYLALQKGLDVLLAQPQVDRKRVGVTGLSGGGWQTIVISALDERVTLSVPVAGYTSMLARVGCPPDIGDLEQCPPDLTTATDYQQMTALLAPRPTLLILNENDDCCFATPRTRPVIYDAVMPTWKAFGAAARFQTHNNLDPGTHNYDADNRAALYRFLSEQWGLPGPARDLQSKREMLTEGEMRVGVPETQETMQTLAVKRGRKLAHERQAPRTAAERKALRARLREVLRLPEYEATLPKGFATRGGVLEVGPWRVPVSVRQQRGGTVTEIIVADAGRTCHAAFPPAHPAAERSFFADIQGTGENAVGWPLEMMLESTGQRLLGQMVAQILAISRAAAAATGVQQVRLSSMYARCGMAALLAAGLEPGLFESVISYGNLGSVQLLLETCERYESLPAVFCFGLLEVADVPELIALLEKVTYRQPTRNVPCVRGGCYAMK